MEDEVKAIIVSVMEMDKDYVNKIRKDSSLKNDLGFDSVRMMIFITFLEEKFDVEIDEKDISNITTVSDGC
jgi:acyl carrier protein